ncbi:MAG: hydantoinase/oxoprolinase family protein [Gemmatimonadetes bacterium]|nr:hydantoinase/oxoprolinase family protein [Gemmatimonadota bacterium]
MNSRRNIVVGIDTGGTFTDFVVLDGGRLRVHKEPSTPDNPANAVLAGLKYVLDGEVVNVVHGSTVATNALLERRGAKTVLVTTHGFEDVLEIGRQTRSDIYDLNVEKAAPLVPAERRLGVPERVDPQGRVLEPLSEESVRELVDQVRGLNPDSVAICLLHSYANPDHERALLMALEDELDAFVTASHLVLPEFREYERCSTTVVNAYVGPVMSRYLAYLAEALESDRVRIMQSNGGIVSLEAARQHAVQTVLSGPAGGAVGGFEMGRRSGYDKVITFDMGGTSTDVCLCPGELSRTTEAIIAEAPIRVPVIDIHTVGAGGGSIAYRDPGGSLRVGPLSAGAEPGPICYQRGGTELTVTDANLFLGRLSPTHFLGGNQELPVKPVNDAMEVFAREMNLSPVEAAEGILRVANATMERAIRVISLERGHDPRDFTLVCFGGAGAMHAADLARNLNIPRVLVPQAAGILSALGMLLADFVRDYSRTLLVRSAELDSGDLERAFVKLETRARTEYEAEGFVTKRLVMERSLDMRYVGQGYELAVPMTQNFEAAFHELHETRYGYADPTRETEVVNVRLRSVGRTEKPPVLEHELEDEDASAAMIGEWRMVFDGRARESQLVDRAKLRPGNAFKGPALVVEYSTTTVVPPDFRCRVDKGENLILEPVSL